MGIGPVQPLEQIFRFNPRWWWDPAPEWVLGRLDRDGLLALAMVHLDVHKQVIQAQMNALEQTQAALNKHLQR